MRDLATERGGRAGALGEAYISGALTALSRGVAGRMLYELLGEIAEAEGFRVYVPHRYTDPVARPAIEPHTVYEVDRQHVAGAAVVIAYAGIPSFGVGTEVEVARESGVPVVLIAEEGRAISRILLGNPVVREVVRFTDLPDLRARLREALQRASVERRPAGDAEAAVVQRFLRSLADARRLPEPQIAALLRRGGITDDSLAQAVRGALASGRLFGAGLRDLVGRHGLRAEELAAFLSRYVLGRRAPRGPLASALARLRLSADEERVSQWLVTELIAAPPRALQLGLFAAAQTERTPLGTRPEET